VGKVLSWLRGLDLIVLLAGLVVVGGLWAFILIAAEVNGERTQALDERILLTLRNPKDLSEPIGPEWVREAGRDMTAVGGVAFLTLMTTAVFGYLLISGKYGAATLVAAASVGGLVLNSALKGLFDRPRPSVVPHLSFVASPSFPSGHSMLSAIIYLTLGALLARFVEHRRQKVYFLAVALLLTILVGCSRVYLGVHYPTDVLAGWSAGLGWATLCWLIARFLQRHGAVEQPAE
jgi:undecaprenyl-diphosphatase